jgi:hypothetical protein
MVAADVDETPGNGARRRLRRVQSQDVLISGEGSDLGDARILDKDRVAVSLSRDLFRRAVGH